MKKTLAFVLTLVLLLSCALGASAEIEIEFWNYLTGGDAAYMDEIVTSFNSTNTSGIVVKSNVMKSDEMLAKLIASTSANAGMPDCCFLGVGDVPLHASNGLLIGMNELIEKCGIDKSDVPPNYFDAVTINNEIYLMPIEVHPWVMFYNKTLLAEIGYTEADVIDMNIDKMVEMMQKCMEQGGDYYGLSLSGADLAVFTRLFDSALYQGGASIFKDDNITANFNTPEAVAAVTQYSRLGQYTVPQGTAGRPVFVAGKCLFHFNGVWERSQLDNDEVRAVLDWGVVPFPQLLGNERRVWADLGGISLTIANDTPERLAATMEFVKYVRENALIFCQAGHLPSSYSLMESESFKNHLFYEWKNSSSEFVLPPSSSGYPVFTSQAVPEFTMLYWGDKTDVQATLDTAVQSTNEIIENQ
ncbi:MAG: extracellular solute-binding protein [Clostridia bacterium]